jgi:ferritin-like metal-binding protein YciE
MRALLADQVRGLMSAERQIVSALPRMIRRTSDPVLDEVLRERMLETQGQILRLELMAELLETDGDPDGWCGIEGLIQRGVLTVDRTGHEVVRDAAIVANARLITYFEIASYTSARELALLLGYDSIVRLLDESLAEDIGADRKLAEIAEWEIHPQAVLSDAMDPELVE